MVNLVIKGDLITFNGQDHYFDGYEAIDSESILFKFEDFGIKLIYNDTTINGYGFNSLKELTNWIDDNM